MTSLVFVLVLTIASVTAAGAQTPTPVPAPTQPVPAPDLPSAPADFTYSASGRRDPFLSLAPGNKGPITSGGPGTVARRAADLLVDELSVRGIVFSNGGYVAMVSGPGGKTQTYTVRPGSRLFDGTVQSITADAVVILQQVSDPLSLEKQRSVRKPLRTQEEGK